MSILKNGTVTAQNVYELGSGSTYTKVGTLTDNRGVFSGFSGTSYIDTNCTISAFSDKLEIYGSYTTGTDLTNEKYIICLNPRNLGLQTISSKFRMVVFNNNSNWVMASSSTTITANTFYQYKIISDNTTIRFYLLTNSGWVNEISITLPTASTAGPLSFGVFSPNNPKTSVTDGSIDIKDYEIKVSGKTIWNGLDAYLLNNNAKVGKYFIGGSGFYEV